MKTKFHRCTKGDHLKAKAALDQINPATIPPEYRLEFSQNYAAIEAKAERVNKQTGALARTHAKRDADGAILFPRGADGRQDTTREPIFQDEKRYTEDLEKLLSEPSGIHVRLIPGEALKLLTWPLSVISPLLFMFDVEESPLEDVDDERLDEYEKRIQAPGGDGAPTADASPLPDVSPVYEHKPVVTPAEQHQSSAD